MPREVHLCTMQEDLQTLKKSKRCPVTPSYSGRLAVIGYISHFHDFEEPLVLIDWDNWFDSDV